MGGILLRNRVRGAKGGGGRLERDGGEARECGRLARNDVGWGVRMGVVLGGF